MECQYCNSVFRTKTNLNKHHRTAKYCLVERGLLPSEYICEGCNIHTSSQIILYSHQDSCLQYQLNLQKNNYEYKLKLKNIQIKNLQETFHEVLGREYQTSINMDKLTIKIYELIRDKTTNGYSDLKIFQ